MKEKKSFSKLDYYLFLLEDYKDRLTLAIVLNLIALFLGSKLNDYFVTVYLESNFQDIFNLLNHQSDLLRFYEALFYSYIISFIIQLAGSKLNKSWIIQLNGWLLFCSSTYYWSNISFDSILDVLEAKNYIFYFVLLFQILFYIVFFNEIFKKRVIKSKINHS